MVNTELAMQAVTAIGLLAFSVSAVTEVIKGVRWLSRIPTDFVVLSLSMLFTVTAFFAYMQYANIAIAWYYVVGAVIGGFFVAFIAMYGWDKLSTLWSRYSSSSIEK